jgi:hypothetical protein
MSEMRSEGAPRRTVRAVEGRGSEGGVERGIDDLYDDRLDVLVIRDALPARPLAHAAELLARADRDVTWSRPNAVAPLDDIHILGTDTPATPTYSAPTGASLDAYLSGATKHRAQTADLFPPEFDVISEVETALRRAAGGRPVEAARASDGRPFTPFTVRRLVEGKQIGLHHDYHYRLPLYSQLAPRLDTRTLISWVFTLQAPSSGGELMVYGVTSDATDVPKDAYGRPDLTRVEKMFDVASFATNTGDLFLLASGRCYHRVSPISGTSRVTMGGFLALDRQRERVLYWS